MMKEVKKAVLHLIINADNGGDLSTNRSLYKTWKNREKRYGILSCLQEISYVAEEYLVLLVDCTETLKHHRDRKRTSFWPLWLRFLQDCYGVHTLCILKKQVPFASLDIVLRGMTSEETIDRVCREADALYRLYVHGGDYSASNTCGWQELLWTDISPASIELGSRRTHIIEDGLLVGDVSLREDGSLREDASLREDGSLRKDGSQLIKDVQLETPPASLDPSTPSSFDTAVLGGTFDHLHSGHKILLSMSAWLSERRVVCGVTGGSTWREFRWMLIQ